MKRIWRIVSLVLSVCLVSTKNNSKYARVCFYSPHLTILVIEYTTLKCIHSWVRRVSFLQFLRFCQMLKILPQYHVWPMCRDVVETFAFSTVSKLSRNEWCPEYCNHRNFPGITNIPVSYAVMVTYYSFHTLQGPVLFFVRKKFADQSHTIWSTPLFFAL